MVERVLGRKPWTMMPRRVQNEHEDAKLSTRRPTMSPKRPQEVNNEPLEAENEHQEAPGGQQMRPIRFQEAKNEAQECPRRGQK